MGFTWMASLVLSISEWCPYLTSCPTSLVISDNLGYIGCSDGRIFGFDEHTLNVEMIMKSSGYPIVGLKLGSFHIDQPFSAIPVLLSFDSNGNLAIWAQNDGRCLMQNPTGLKPTGLIKVSDYILTWGRTSCFSIFRASSLEQIQTICLPDEEVWINQIIQINMGSKEISDCKILCLLDNGSVWQYDFNESNGKISSAGKCLQKLPKDILFLTGHEDQLFILTENGIVNYDLKNDQFKMLSLKIFDALFTLTEVETFHSLDSRTLLISNSNGNTFIVTEDGHFHQFLDKKKHIVCRDDSYLIVFTDRSVCSLVEIHYFDDVEEKELPFSSCFASDHITASSLSPDGTLALGFKSGLAKLSLFSEFIMTTENETDSSVSIFNTTNSKPITAILKIKNILVTGDSEGQINFWNCLYGSLTCSFKCHVNEILAFLALKKGSEMENELYAISKDGSVSIFQVKHTIAKRYIIQSRYGHQIAKLHWATPFDDFILVEYSDQISHLWNLKSGAFEKEFYPETTEFNEIRQIFKLQYLVGGDSSLVGRDSSGISQVFLEAIHAGSTSASFDIDFRKLMGASIYLEHEEAQILLVSLLKKLISGLLSVLIPKSQNSDLPDEFQHTKTFSWGIYGAGNNVTFINPQKDLYACSPVSSSIACMCFCSLASSFSSLPSAEFLDKYFAQCLNHLPLESSQFQLPSLSSLSKYWSDPDYHMQNAAREIISFVMKRMDESLLSGFIQYWLQYLPFYNVENGKSMSRAAIIFGIVSLHNPNSLNERVRKAVAESLISQLGTEVRNIFRCAVIELLGSAFEIWEPYIVTMKLFKALFEWIPKVAPNFEDLESFSDPSLAMTISAAAKTLVQIISFNSLAVMPFWLAEVNNSKSLNEKMCALSIFSKVVQENPHCIKGYVPVIVDMIVRFLDPNVPTTRSALYSKVLTFITDLEHQYSFIDYKKEYRRLLVGGMDGVLVLFDLKTATRSHTFEGQTRGVTALSFSSDCKFICSYSFDEVTVRIWAVPSGFLSILNMVCRPVKTIVVDPVLTTAVAQIPEHLRSNTVRIYWTDEHHVQISLHNSLVHKIKVF